MATDDVLIEVEEADPAEEVDLDEAPEEERAEVDYDEDAANLVAAFLETPEGKEALKEISQTVRDNYDEGYAATEELREREAKNWSIFCGVLPEKDFPYENAANCNVPVMFEATMRIMFRAFTELFPDWDNICGVRSLGPGGEEEAALVTLHTNWQLRSQILDFRRQMFKGMLQFWINGDPTCHSWYDPGRRMNRHEFLSREEFVVPYTAVSTMPDWSDVPYKIKVLHRQKHEIEAMRGIWEDIEAVIEDREPSWNDEPTSHNAEEAAEESGVELTEGSAPYKLLWYEGYLDLPGQDRQRYCKVIVDYAKGAVLELSIHEYPNWQDVARYDAQVRELQDFRAQQEFHASQQMMAEAAPVAMQTSEPMEVPPLPEAPVMTAPELPGMPPPPEPIPIPPPPPPVPPSWMRDENDPAETPEPARKDPVHLFVHIPLIEPLVGNIGIGYGNMEADFNRAANTTLNQTVDAATMANCGILFVCDIVEMPPQLTMMPGKIHKVGGVSPGELKDALVPYTPKGADPALINVTEKMYEFGQRAMQAPDAMSGEEGKSGEPFRGLMARIEQATKQLSAPTRRFADGLEWILKNHAFLNSVHLNEEEIFHVAESKDPEVALMAKKIGRRAYERNYHYEIRSDLRFVTQSQRIGEADELLKMGQAFPQLSTNPAIMWALLAGAFKARGRDDLVALLGPKPPPPAVPMAPPAPPRPIGPPGMPGMPGMPKVA
jgi:hypothetical protein